MKTFNVKNNIKNFYNLNNIPLNSWDESEDLDDREIIKSLSYCLSDFARKDELNIYELLDHQFIQEKRKFIKKI